MKRKPRGYWTFERCRQEAARFDTITDFQKYSGSACNRARQENWLEDIGAHFQARSSQNGYWTKQRCAEVANRCESLSDFYKTSAGGAAKRNGWWEELTRHIARRRPKPVVWTKELCKVEAQKYKTKTEFLKGFPRAYHAAKRLACYDEVTSHLGVARRRNGDRSDGFWTKRRCVELAQTFRSKKAFRETYPGVYGKGHLKGWWNEMSAHMRSLRRPNGYWTKRNCAALALEYETRADFKKASGSAYLIARRENWLDDICAHMKFVGNRNIRCVYQIRFEDGSIYIGLTYNPDERLASHIKNTKQLQSKFSKLAYKWTVSDFMSADDAASEEKRLIAEAHASNLNVLNMNRGGSLGTSEEFWTKDKCKEIASLFKTRKQLASEYSGCYAKMQKNGWIKELCAHMTAGKKGKKIWTKKRCAEEAAKYRTRTTFARSGKGAYGSARKAGWLDEICKHMVNKRITKVN